MRSKLNIGRFDPGGADRAASRIPGSAERDGSWDWVPEDTPFLWSSPGDPFSGCRSVNAYFTAAAVSGAVRTAGRADCSEIRRRYAYPLRHLLQHLWSVRSRRVELTEVLERELIDYRQLRLGAVGPGTWNNQQSVIRSFFNHAVDKGWIEESPCPVWNRKSTLPARYHESTERKFLFDDEAGSFLGALSGSGFCYHCGEFVGVPSIERRNSSYGTVRRPLRFPNRDSAIVETILGSGLRHMECLSLLDCEIPSLGPVGEWAGRVPNIPATRLPYQFRIRGKFGKERKVTVLGSAVAAIDKYRVTERRETVERAQGLLRKKLRDGVLLPATVDLAGGSVSIDGGPIQLLRRVPANERARLVSISSHQGQRIEPLGLFLNRNGSPFRNHQHLSSLISAVAEHLAAEGHACSPRIAVGAHTFRHTAGVRTFYKLAQGFSETMLLTPLDIEAASGSVVVQVAQMLGHSDPEFTRVTYLRGVMEYSVWKATQL